MGTLFRKIQAAIANDHYLVSWHADERCEERGITEWQIITEVEAIWAYLAESGRAMLVTVYFVE